MRFVTIFALAWTQSVATIAFPAAAGEVHEAPVAPHVGPAVFATRDLRLTAARHAYLRSRAFDTSYAYLTVHRNSVFSDSINYLTMDAPGNAKLPHVTFAGEGGVDAGGLGREWFTLLGRQIFELPSTDPLGGLFVTRGDTEYLELDLSRPLDGLSDAYAALGVYLGMSFAYNMPVGVPLPRMFFQKLLGRAASVDDLKLDDPELFRNLKEAQEGGINMLRMLGEVGDQETVPDVPLRMKEYIDGQLAEFFPPDAESRMLQIREGFEIFMTWPSVVTADDFRSVVYGNPEISVDDMIAHTTCAECYTKSAEWLWQWLRNSNNDVRRQFLKFVTGLDQLPVNGMAGLKIPMTILRPFRLGPLPMARTVFYSIELPEYRTYEDLVKFMEEAIPTDTFSMA